MLVTATACFPFAPIKYARNEYYVVTVGEADSTLSYFTHCFLTSSQVMALMHPSRFSFKNIKYFRASCFPSDTSFAHLGFKVSLSCNSLN